MEENIIILCTISTYEEAKKIAKELVKKRMAACVNIIEKITSIYQWKEEICDDKECLMIIKSRGALFDIIKKEILSLHPYEIPEIISLQITGGLEAYLNWMRENTE